MKSLILFTTVALAILDTCVAKPPFTPGREPEVSAPVGRLGYHIGTYLTIEGVRAERGKVGVQPLLVDRIGDYKLDEPVGIWIENVDLPKGERCVFKGYETGRWIGTPDKVLEATGASTPQAAWQFRFYFIATSAEEPSDLKLKQP